MRSARDNLKFMQNMAKMAGSTAGSFGEIRSQIKDLVKDGLERVMGELDMVSRDEFDRVEAIALKAREKQVALEKRLAALEKKPAAPKAAAKTKAKTTKKKKAKK